MVNLKGTIDIMSLLKRQNRNALGTVWPFLREILIESYDSIFVQRFALHTNFHQIMGRKTFQSRERFRSLIIPSLGIPLPVLTFAPIASILEHYNSTQTPWDKDTEFGLSIESFVINLHVNLERLARSRIDYPFGILSEDILVRLRGWNDYWEARGHQLQFWVLIILEELAGTQSVGCLEERENAYSIFPALCKVEYFILANISELMETDGGMMPAQVNQS
jgi:hypothetical protein